MAALTRSIDDQLAILNRPTFQIDDRFARSSSQKFLPEAEPAAQRPARLPSRARQQQDEETNRPSLITPGGGR